MRERPARRRFRGRRSRPAQPRPTQAPQQRGPREAPERAASERADRRFARPRQRPPRPREADALRPGSPAVILVDAREGEPDRSGESAVFEGFFDFETGEPRRSATGIPRLRVGDERLWGFECWWRADPTRAGFTAADREEVEASKRLLRGLLRDARRSAARLAAR